MPRSAVEGLASRFPFEITPGAEALESPTWGGIQNGDTAGVIVGKREKDGASVSIPIGAYGYVGAVLTHVTAADGLTLVGYGL